LKAKGALWIRQSLQQAQGRPCPTLLQLFLSLIQVSTYSIDRIFLLWNTRLMAWEVEFTDEFDEWWSSLNEAEQEDIEASVMLLRELGPTLGRPHADLVTTSAYPNMKELRTQHDGKPYRTLFVFDPRRVAILLIGGDKTGNDRWVHGVRATGRQDLRRASAAA
jgi:hypothetical protein